MSLARGSWFCPPAAGVAQDLDGGKDFDGRQLGKASGTRLANGGRGAGENDGIVVVAELARKAEVGGS
jgi:hypothetical protein